MVNNRVNHHALAGRKVASKQAIQSLRKAFDTGLGQEPDSTRVHAQNGRVVPERHVRRRKHRAVAANGKQQVGLAKFAFLDNLDGLAHQIFQVIQHAERHLRMFVGPARNHVEGKSQIRVLVFPAHDTNRAELEFFDLVHYDASVSGFAVAISKSCPSFCKTPG